MTGSNVVSGAPPIPSERGPPPLSLYIHIPWCVRKCPYCDFNSHEFQGVLPETAYVSAVLGDLEHEAGRIGGRQVQTIFIGGGTPSLLSGEAVRCLLSGVRARVAVATAAEVTLESNPGSVDGGRLMQYLEAGVNRLSIGVQSFRARQLAALGRMHSVDDALRAFETARRAGVSNINLDLMFGLPEDDLDGSLQDLSQAIALGPEHLSWYQLAIEPDTAFFATRPSYPTMTRYTRPTKRAARCCASAATSSTRFGLRARWGRMPPQPHYWEFGIIWGSGPGRTASSAISRAGASCAARNARSPCPINGSYMNGAGSLAAIVEGPPLTEAQLTVEFMMNALRLAAGFPLSLFTERTGLPVEAITDTLDAASERGLIEVRAGWIRTHRMGLPLPQRVGISLLSR